MYTVPTCKGKANYRAALYCAPSAFCSQTVLGIIQIFFPIRLYTVGMMIFVAETIINLFIFAGFTGVQYLKEVYKKAGERLFLKAC